MLMLVCILGIVFGLIHLGKAKVPLTVMIASLGALLLVSLASLVLEPMVYGLFGSAPSGGRTISALLTLWRWFSWFVEAAATAGLIFAVLYGRGFDVLHPSTSLKQ